MVRMRGKSHRRILFSTAVPGEASFLTDNAGSFCVDHVKQPNLVKFDCISEICGKEYGKLLWLYATGIEMESSNRGLQMRRLRCKQQRIRRIGQPTASVSGPSGMVQSVQSCSEA